MLVSQSKEPRSIPTAASDGERDLREAGVGLAAPGEAVGKYGDPVHLAIPFATENGAGRTWVLRRVEPKARRAAVSGVSE